MPSFMHLSASFNGYLRSRIAIVITALRDEEDCTQPAIPAIIMSHYLCHQQQKQRRYHRDVFYAKVASQHCSSRCSYESTNNHIERNNFINTRNNNNSSRRFISRHHKTPLEWFRYMCTHRSHRSNTETVSMTTRTNNKEESMSAPSADITCGRPSSCRASHVQAPTVN